MWSTKFNLGFLVVMLFLGQLSGQAQLYRLAEPKSAGVSNTLTIAWNPSPSGDVAGYFLYWGPSSDRCTNRVSLRNTTSATLVGLRTNTIYYFAVAACDAAGEESPLSNQVQFSVPQVTPSTSGPKLRLELMGPANTNSVLRLIFPANAGVNYQLQATEDFQQWNNLFTTNCAQAQDVAFELPYSAAVPHRFFRLRR